MLFKINRGNKGILFCIAFIMAVTMTGICSAELNDITQIKEFLLNDTTDQHEYLPYYSCGHFTRDLALNASEHNLTLGGVILGYHPVFRGYNNHIMNYVVVNSSIWIIEPQTDQIMKLNETMHIFYRLYPDGTQVPSNWKYNLAPTGIIV